MKNINKILDEAEKIQNELHTMIAEVRKTNGGKNIPYQDLVVVFFLTKLAELKEEIKEAGLILKN
jgi:hypothetical protein